MSTRAISPEMGAGKPLDANRYATKKTIAQGMLDIALLTANASQLKYVLTIGQQHQFYSLMISLITVSIVLQVLVGIVFLLIGGLDINQNSDCRPATILNDLSLILIFVISLINVIISGFGMEQSSTPLMLIQREQYYAFNYTKVIQAIIYIVLSSAYNINKKHDQNSANVWNNIALSLIVMTVTVNVVISAFDMRETDGIQPVHLGRNGTDANITTFIGRLFG